MSAARLVMLDKFRSDYLSHPRYGKLLHAGLLALAILAVFTASFIPRRMDINRPVLADETLWLRRSTDFYSALERKKPEATFRSGHPGVTIMWAGAGGLWTKYQEFIDNQTKKKTIPIETYLENEVDANPLGNLVAARIWVIFLQSILLALSYWLAQRLVGPIPALIGFLLIAFDPFHISLTRILHLDGLLGDLILLSLLAYLNYLRGHKLLDLILCGASTGLTWLTKSPGLFILPIFGLLALYDLWLASQEEGKASLARRLFASAWPVAAVTLIAGLVFVALWPAMWVDPLNTVAKVLSMAEDYAAEGHENVVFFNGYLAENGDLGMRFWYFYPLTYLWRTTPAVMIGLLLAAWAIFTRRKPFTEPGVRLTLVGIVITVVLFTVGLTLSLKKFDRYLLPVYAPLDILAGLGWFAFASWVGGRLPASLAKIGPPVILALAIGIQAASALSISPYYFAYYNPLMGGGRKATQVMQVGWGEGMDLAAEYLNAKDNHRSLRVMSRYSSAPFTDYFRGEVVKIPSTKFTSNDWYLLKASDYIVLYISNWQRKTSQELAEYLSNLTPEHTIWINGIEYVRIYKTPK